METDGQAGGEVVTWVLRLRVKASCKERRVPLGRGGEGAGAVAGGGCAEGGIGCCTGADTGAGAGGGGSHTSSCRGLNLFPVGTQCCWTGGALLPGATWRPFVACCQGAAAGAEGKEEAAAVPEAG